MIGVLIMLVFVLFASLNNTPQIIAQDQQKILDSLYISHIILSSENKFTDTFKEGSFTRSGNSGPGTGQFIGRAFEFAKGNCYNIDPKWLKDHGWIPDSPGCGGMLLQSDWCARLKSKHEIKYTLHFLSWTKGPEGPNQKCMGDCVQNNNHTAYIRIRVHQILDTGF